MWESIRQFFSKLFGTAEEEVMEDAAQLLDDEVVISIEEPTEEELAARSKANARSRGGLLETVSIVPLGEDGKTICIHNPRYYWILDNGHGKLQSGKRSPKFEDGSQFEEWEFTRDIVARMIPKLDEANVQYLNLVPEVEISSFLKGRVDRANAATHPLGMDKIYVSIHANAFGNGSAWSTSESARGLETWHFPGSDSGMKLSSVFHKKLVEALGWRDRGVKSHQKGSRKVFYVLQNTSMPAVLTECGFYTNKEETELLRRDDIRQMIADAHVAAILEVEQNDWKEQEIHRPRMVLA